MARKKHYDTYPDMLQHFLALYYAKRGEMPGLKYKPEEHRREVINLNNRYLKQLHKYHPDWENDTTLKQFIVEIEFLTGCKIK